MVNTDRGSRQKGVGDWAALSTIGSMLSCLLWTGPIKERTAGAAGRGVQKDPTDVPSVLLFLRSFSVTVERNGNPFGTDIPIN